MLQLAASACTAVRDQLSGPAHLGRVVGRSPDAAYIQSAAGVVAVLTDRAVRVPCAAVLGPGRSLPGSLRTGAEVRVGNGQVRWHDNRQPPGGNARDVTSDLTRDLTRDVVVVATGWWPPDQVQPWAARPAFVSDERPLTRLEAVVHEHPLPPGVPQALDLAGRALAEGDEEDAANRLVTVLGSGVGLTPSADDAVAGLLLTARALAATPAQALAAARLGQHVAEAARSRTNAVSAALLLHAGQGRGAGQLVAAVSALTQGWPDPELADALGALVGVGHTSGTDTACGILATLRAFSRPAARLALRNLR